MFWAGFGIGLVIGVVVGFGTAALMMVAGRSEEISERDFLKLKQLNESNKKDRNEFERKED